MRNAIIWSISTGYAWTSERHGQRHTEACWMDREQAKAAAADLGLTWHSPCLPPVAGCTDKTRKVAS
jgi:hypothetical protein